MSRSLTSHFEGRRILCICLVVQLSNERVERAYMNWEHNCDSEKDCISLLSYITGLRLASSLTSVCCICALLPHFDSVSINALWVYLSVPISTMRGYRKRLNHASHINKMSSGSAQKHPQIFFLVSGFCVTVRSSLRRCIRSAAVFFSSTSSSSETSTLNLRTEPASDWSFS
jgi:hypothetical protein